LPQRGQPVLVGTTSVEKSDALSRILERKGVRHNVLNAKQHEREAYVVAQAGEPGAVTVATNMAGRGTDIVLGGNPEMLARMEVLEKSSPELLEDREAFETAIAQAIERHTARCEEAKKKVKEAGGLHIVGTERHESRRVDNQLRGRSGRQGDPGASRFFLSLEDDLMRIFAGDRIQGMMDRLGMEEDVPIEHRWVSRAVENAQKKVEERNFDIRKNLLDYDDVMNQQRKSVYTLRRQVLEGQYRTVPTEAEVEKGARPERLVTEADAGLAERVQPVLERVVKFHAAPAPPQGAGEDDISAWRQQAIRMDMDELGEVRSPQALARDVYWMFGLRLELGRDPHKVLERIQREVPLSLTEQQERLLDLVDEIIGTMVEHACPPNKHYEEWDLEALAQAYEEQFGIEATGLEEITDAGELAKKLYGDAEAILRKKQTDFGEDTFLRLFRNLYLEEIDRQWIEHLQAMDHLRDGIGLRGYGQRDPKREYKREGYNMFTEMMQGIKSSVSNKLFRLERIGEEDVERIESRRRKQSEARQQHMRANHPGMAQDGGDGAGAPAAPNRRARRRGAAGGASAGAPQVDQTVKRERPKVKRNDPCWCGSGKKYKQCHWREDQAATATQ
jgi:preprotein translocase subunit SecA